MTDHGGAASPLDILDLIDGIVDDTHPEGDGCPLCVALDDLRDVLEAAAQEARAPEGLRAWLDDPLRDYLDDRDRAFLESLAPSTPAEPPRPDPEAVAVVANIRALHKPDVHWQMPGKRALDGPCVVDGSAWPCDAEYAARLLSAGGATKP